MSSPLRPIPRLARADRRERRVLAAWLSRSVEDDDATDLLLEAYERTPRARRLGFVAWVEGTLREAGHRPAPVLARLAAVEDDEATLLAIVARLGLPAFDGRPIAARADGKGGVVLVLGHGHTAESLHVSPAAEGRVDVSVGAVPAPHAPAALLPIDEAVDRAAHLLWHHVRSGGALPDGASRFAHLFVP